MQTNFNINELDDRNSKSQGTDKNRKCDEAPGESLAEGDFLAGAAGESLLKKAVTQVRAIVLISCQPLTGGDGIVTRPTPKAHPTPKDHPQTIGWSR